MYHPCHCFAIYGICRVTLKSRLSARCPGPVAVHGDQNLPVRSRQAIRRISNFKGGIKGDASVAVKYDDACDPKCVVAVANKVVNDGIKYVIGHLCSFHTASLLISRRRRYPDDNPSAATALELTARGYNSICARPASTLTVNARQSIFWRR